MSSVAFENSGSFAKAVYGDASSQHAGSSGTIINMNDVRSSGVGGPVMKGGRKRSDKKRSDKKRSAKRSDKKRSSRMQQNGGKSKSRKQQKGGK
jgi:hypothetical protein